MIFTWLFNNARKSLSWSGSLKDHPRVHSCGGCPYQFMKSYPPPDDIIIAHKKYDSWRDAQAGVLRRSNNLANRY